MKTITNIKQQIKRQDRYSVFVDDTYSFSFSESELLNSGLKIGQSFTDLELEQLKKTALEDKAYSRSLDLLARRPRSEWELRDYLRRKEYDTDTADRIVARLQKRGYIDDKQFADSWVNSRRLLKKTSQRKLWQELKQKRIAEEVINQVLSEDETDEQQVLRDLIDKKRTQSRYQDSDKLTQYLLRQGFRYDDIKAVYSGEQ